MSLKNLQLEKKPFIDDSVKANIQNVFDIGLFGQYYKQDDTPELLSFQTSTK